MSRQGLARKPGVVLIVILTAIGLWSGTARGDRIIWGMDISLLRTAITILFGVAVFAVIFSRRR